MKPLVIDVETTTFNEGNPFDGRNKLCAVALYDVGSGSKTVPIEYDGSPYREGLEEIRRRIESVELIIGFNIKFDLHWLRRYGFSIPDYCYDCQLGDFILNGQTRPFPSLESVGESLSLGGKLDGGLAKYWDVGINTPEIPWDELEAYANRDVELTWQIYLKQQELLASNHRLRTLVNLSCQDLLVLADMEWNGLKFDLELAKQRQQETQEKLDALTKELNVLAGLPNFNWNSGHHISSLLFGGSYIHQWKEQVGVYHTGIKQGEPRSRWLKKEYQLPRLVEPLKGTQLKNGVHYETNKNTLSNLPATGRAKTIINLIQQYSELEKLQSTYYLGIPNLCNIFDWQDGIIHGQYNQVVARTGRLSSSKPNLQNIAGAADDLIISRYAA